ncbi:hypothetical protein OV079_01325 [Nannocystis pusilla]|uniref:Uncharacterized protein n=1 Tax=Nannocystis pusilla TaxID=889268 RepID=A0A9X3EJA3_9BACT|nr:hypothetical protein [Nannocystis pusilla]MCY1004230.1 hypothetical protein [Nannocystis pusilla]
MIEPLDDELRRLVGALREVDRPGDAARASTWAAIDARLAAAPTPRRTAARVSWPLAALAAALVLALGLAAATAWREAERAGVEAVDQHSPDSTPRAVEPRPLRAVETSRSVTGERPGESPQSESPGAASPESIQADAPESLPHPSQLASPESSQPDSPESHPHSSPTGSPESLAHSPPPGSPESLVHSSPPGSPKSRPDPSPPASPEASDPSGPHASPGLEPARPASPSRRRPADSPSLRPEEVASFQRAQAALAAGRYDDALDALDAHGRRFAGGLFEEERQVSRATALCKLGRVDAARDARRRFLRERPGSHLAERMRQICRDDE